MRTRSPFFTLLRLSTLAKRQTSRWSCWYVSTRFSPGSPSHISAALFWRAVPRWRSRQFSETLSLPPTNHLAFGSFHSSTVVHFCCHLSSAASRAKNFSGFLIDSSYISLYCARLWMRAFLEKSLAGLKTRFSTRWDSMELLLMGLGKVGSHELAAAPRFAQFKVATEAAKRY